MIVIESRRQLDHSSKLLMLIITSTSSSPSSHHDHFIIIVVGCSRQLRHVFQLWKWESQNQKMMILMIKLSMMSVRRRRWWWAWDDDDDEVKEIVMSNKMLEEVKVKTVHAPHSTSTTSLHQRHHQLHLREKVIFSRASPLARSSLMCSFLAACALGEVPLGSFLAACALGEVPMGFLPMSLLGFLVCSVVSFLVLLLPNSNSKTQKTPKPHHENPPFLN